MLWIVDTLYVQCYTADVCKCPFSSAAWACTAHFSIKVNLLRGAFKVNGAVFCRKNIGWNLGKCHITSSYLWLHVLIPGKKCKTTISFRRVFSLLPWKKGKKRPSLISTLLKVYFFFLPYLLTQVVRLASYVCVCMYAIYGAMKNDFWHESCVRPSRDWTSRRYSQLPREIRALILAP